jgi:hypothetical protein
MLNSLERYNLSITDISNTLGAYSLTTVLPSKYQLVKLLLTRKLSLLTFLYLHNMHLVKRNNPTLGWGTLTNLECMFLFHSNP